MFDVKKTFLITGGAGFIGSHMVDLLVSHGQTVIVLDALTYAGDKQNLSRHFKNQTIQFHQGNINNRELVYTLLYSYSVDVVINFAAETHVDNSIDTPDAFVKSNILGTFELLQASMSFLNTTSKSNFKFIQISTDEVFGEIDLGSLPFTEDTPYSPRSPYSASKAGADHLVQSWINTYGFPGIITYCSNNFGPRQNDEKLIPTIIRNAIFDEKIPIYGDGMNIRNWISVKDHCQGIYLTSSKGFIGESYCFGGELELKNVEVVQKVCELLDQKRPNKRKTSYFNQMHFIPDRKGHDRHYSINYNKAYENLGYQPKQNFYSALSDTIDFYIQKYS